MGTKMWKFHVLLVGVLWVIYKCVIDNRCKCVEAAIFKGGFCMFHWWYDEEFRPASMQGILKVFVEETFLGGKSYVLPHSL